MPLTIAGSQFIASGSSPVYTVGSIPDGYSLGSVTLPSGWTSSPGSIVAGSQNITVTTNKTSGTIIANYIADGLPNISIALDVSSDATTQGGSITTSITKGGSTTSLNTISNVSLYTITNFFLKAQLGTICPPLFSGCPFALSVFADVNNPNPLYNDKSDFYYQGGPNTESITMTLQQSNGCNGVWTDILPFSKTYVRQASLIVPIPTWSGNYYMLGTFTIGAVVLNITYNGTYSGYLTYLAAQINAQGTYSATVQSGGITISGKNGAISNGKAVSQKMDATTSQMFKAQIKPFSLDIHNGFVSGVSPSINIAKQTFSTIDLNNGGNWANGSYTASAASTQIFSGAIWWQAMARITSNFRSASITINLKKNGTTVSSMTAPSSVLLGNGGPNETAFAFPAQTLSIGDIITLNIVVTLNMVASGPGTIQVGEYGGTFLSNSATTTSTSWGFLEGGIAGIGTFAKVFYYGTAPDYSGNPFVDDNGNQYTGALLSWLPILQTFGAGQYRMQIVTTDINGNITTTYDNRIFCLSQYNCNAADGTIRIEYYNIGERGVFNDGWIDYASANLPLSNGSFINGNYQGWYSQIRLEAIVYLEKSAYTKEYSQYGDDEDNAYKPVINEQTPKIKCDIMPIPGWMDFIISTNILQADEILFTDYNLANRHTLIQVPVINDGDVTLNPDKLMNQLAAMKLSLSYGLNNLRRRND